MVACISDKLTFSLLNIKSIYQTYTYMYGTDMSYVEIKKKGYIIITLDKYFSYNYKKIYTVYLSRFL